MATLLNVDAVTQRFGGLLALNEVSFTVEAGEIRGLIGPNGAGKTTLFNCITGTYKQTSGVIALEGKSFAGKKPHAITRAGIARTFQNIRLFSAMTALENVLVGSDSHNPNGVFRVLVRGTRTDKAAVKDSRELLSFVGIGGMGSQLASNLSYGDQRRLEIARALATKPKLLLLDEPAAGMNPAEKASLMDLIRQVRDTGVTILLIEHDMKLVMGVCERVAVLDFGQKIADGRPEQIQRDPKVIEAYLGAGAAGAAGSEGA